MKITSKEFSESQSKRHERYENYQIPKFEHF